MTDWDRIERFIGFGRRDAPVVFIGMEEGLKDAEALDEDLAIRSRYTRDVMDLREAHVGIAGTERYFDPDRAPRQPTWRVMADLMLRRSGLEHPTGYDRRRYRATELGRAHGETLLTELLPYPHPKSSDWLYERFDRFRTRAEYMEAILPDRMRLLRDVLAEARREVVVCYGKAHWPYYQGLFGDLAWRGRWTIPARRRADARRLDDTLQRPGLQYRTATRRVGSRRIIHVTGGSGRPNRMSIATRSALLSGIVH